MQVIRESPGERKTVKQFLVCHALVAFLRCPFAILVLTQDKPGWNEAPRNAWREGINPHDAPGASAVAIVAAAAALSRIEPRLLFDELLLQIAVVSSGLPAQVLLNVSYLFLVGEVGLLIVPGPILLFFFWWLFRLIAN